MKTRICFRRALPLLTPVFAALLTAAVAVPSAAQKPDSVVARARAAINLLHDSASLTKAGYGAIGFGVGVKDLSPFQGQHWIQMARFLVNPPTDLNNPEFMMYIPIGDSLIPVGVAYTHRVPAGAALPTEIGGTPAEWHSHVFCRNLPGEGNALADGPEDCKVRGGVSARTQIAMVHAWTVPNPDGPFAHDNPALPYIATGLTPPARVMKDDRLLGLALGETYGAKLPIAHRIEYEARRAGKGQSLDGPRNRLRDLTNQLRDAEKSGNAAKSTALRKSEVDEYAKLVVEYRALAPSAEMRARFDAELDMATDGMSHHHM